MGRPQGSRAFGLRSLALAALLPASFAAAQPVDEDALFADTSVTDASLLRTPGQAPAVARQATSLAAAAGIAADTARVQVRLSGDVTAQGQGNAFRDRLPSMPSSDGSARVVTDLTLEASLPTRERALLTAELDHEASADTLAFHLREAFVDFDVGQVAWVRAGKQVLQWGRGLLWTPTDLVNVEGKSLVPRAGATEGATGLRLLVPMGQSASLTGFVNLDRVTAADSLSGALRLEGLLGPVEVAASGWAKPDRPWAAGLDASTGVRGTDLQGGILFLRGDLQPHMALAGGKWALVREDDRPQLRASLGIGRSFAAGGLPDRLRLDLEGSWNSRGYGAGVLTDSVTRGYAEPLATALPSSLSSLAGNPLVSAFLRGDTAGSAATFALRNGLYRTSSWGRAYLAGMASFRRFLVEEMTLSAQCLANVQDGSGLSTLGLSWSGLHGFFTSGTAYWFWGDPRTEFALGGTGPALDLRAGVRF